MSANRSLWFVLLLALLLVAANASAHVSVASGPGFAKGRAIVTFGVGHGCEGADTVSIDVHIPPEVTSVRGIPNEFGAADVVVDQAGAPTNVVWTRSSDVRPGDDQYYRMEIRIAVPDAPFTTLYFPVIQKCKDPQGVESMTEWTALPTDPAPTDGAETHPAAPFVILPARMAGWNKYTVPAAVSDLGTYFGDAQIVWAGDAAYSPNAAIAELIEADAAVTTLTELAANTEIWVKY